MGSYPTVTEYFHSPLAPVELLSRLETKVAPGFKRGFSGSALYRGTVSVDSFAIRSISFSPQSFSPVIYGWVKPDLNATGSLLKLQYRERNAVIAGAVFSCLLIIVLGSVLIIPAMQERQLSWPSLFVPIAVLILFGVSIIASFRFQVWLSRRRLAEILELEGAAA